MLIFDVLKIKEEELEEIRLLKADEAMDEEALKKIDALLGLVKAARGQIRELDATNITNFTKKFLQDLKERKESGKEGGKFQQLIQMLETELQNADAELDGERERIERLSGISAKIVDVMERLSQQESFLLKLPVVRGRGIIKELKKINDEDKRQLRAKAQSFKFLIFWLNSIKVSLRDLTNSVPYFIYSVAYHGKSARESYELTLSDSNYAENIQQLLGVNEGKPARGSYALELMKSNDTRIAQDISRVKRAFLGSDKILQDVEKRLAIIKDFLERFRHYLNKTFAESLHALEFEQVLEKLEKVINPK